MSMRSNSMITDNCGYMVVNDAYTFYWMRAKDGEISGHVERDDGSIVSGSSGWYRTDDVTSLLPMLQNKYRHSTVGSSDAA